MTDIIVGHAFDITQPNGQHRLGAIEGLNLAFFIDAEHQGVIRWMQIQADNVAHLFNKEWIGGELKTTSTVGLHAESLKHAMHGRTGDAAGLGSLPNAPVRALGRFAGERTLEQSSNLFVVDAAGSAGPQLVIQSSQAMLDETLSPLADGGIGPPQATGDLGVTLSGCRPEYQSGACHQSMRQSAGTGQATKLGMLVHSQGQGGLGTSRDHAPSLSQACYL